MTKFSSLSKSERGLQKIITSTKFKKNANFLNKSDVFAAVAVVDAKSLSKGAERDLAFFCTFLCRRCTTTT